MKRIKFVFLGIILAMAIPTKASAYSMEPEWIEYIDYVADKFNVPAEVIQAICFTESSYNPKAHNETYDARGLMQVRPKLHDDVMTVDTDLFNAYDCIYVGTEILSQYIDTSESLTEALNRYNGISSKEPSKYSKKILSKANEIKEEK